MSKAGAFWIAILVLALAGCASSSIPVTAPNMELSVLPDPPRVGPATATFVLSDDSASPLTGASLHLEATMTHPGMMPVLADAVETEPGRYEAPFEFTMAGDWVVIVTMELPDGLTAEGQFEIFGVKAE